MGRHTSTVARSGSPSPKSICVQRHPSKNISISTTHKLANVAGPKVTLPPQCTLRKFLRTWSQWLSYFCCCCYRSWMSWLRWCMMWKVPRYASQYMVIRNTGSRHYCEKFLRRPGTSCSFGPRRYSRSDLGNPGISQPKNELKHTATRWNQYRCSH